MAVIAYWNGSFVDPQAPHVPIDERGHQFGDGVYEVVRVYSGRPFLLEAHLQRLANSLAYLSIPNPHSQAEWTTIIHEAIRRSGEPEALVYWQVTRGMAPRAHQFPAVSPSVSLTVRAFDRKPGAAATSVLALPDERWSNAFVKTINLLPNAIAKQVATQSGATEALLVRAGSITEGSSSNAWFVRDNVIYTAPADRWILNGIARQFTLQLARQAGLQVVEEALLWSGLADVDEVFLTGTTIEVLPIQEVWLDPAMRLELEQLPNLPPAALVRTLGPLRTVWQHPSRSNIALQLRSAFLEAVEDFRH